MKYPTIVALMIFANSAAAAPWGFENDECERGFGFGFGFGYSEKISDRVEVYIDSSRVPPHRARELYELEKRVPEIRDRISRYERRLNSSDEPSPSYDPTPQGPTPPSLLDYVFNFSDAISRRFGPNRPPETPVRDPRKTPIQGKQELIDAIRSLKKKLEHDSSRLAILREEDRANLLGLIQANYSRVSPYLQEKLMLKKIISLYPSRAVAVLAGNRFSEPSAAQARELEILIDRLSALNKVIIYDADTRLAPLFEHFGKGHAIGISARDIPNVYRRMSAFGHAEKVIITPDSIPGLAMRLKGKANSILSVDDDFTRVSRMLQDWHSELVNGEINLGISAFSSPAIFESAESLLEQRSLLGKKVFQQSELAPSLSKVTSWGDMSSDELSDVLSDASEMDKGLAKVTKHAPGAVIFGAGKMSGYTKLIYDSVRAMARMGIAITTGGAGGAMRVANAAAYDAGADSIGIPITGTFSLMSEKTIYKEVQTETVASSGYSTRIPLLLANQGMIVIAPGGAGTIQEIAAVILQYAQHTAQGAQPKPTVLLGRDYYLGLWTYLQALPLPKDIKDRIFLADSPQDVEALALWVFGKRPSPTPRNDNDHFVGLSEPLGGFHL